MEGRNGMERRSRMREEVGWRGEDGCKRAVE
jgi:hypothetical protein